MSAAPPQRAWSLTRRLVGRILVAATLVWCLVLVAGLAVVEQEMREVAEEALLAQAQFLAGLLERSAPGATAATPETESGTVRLRLRRPRDPAGDPARDPAGDASGAPASDLPGDAPWPALAADGVRVIDGWSVARATSGDLIVELGRPVALRRGEFWEAARVWLAMTLPLLAVLLLAIPLTLRRALAPVAAFAAEMDRRAAADLSPTEATELPEELRPIARALDRYLARIEALLAAERDFSANAAHELRTPLAVAAAQAQIIAEGRGGPEAARAVMASVATVTALVERLLELARAEAAIGRAGERSDLLRVLRLLIADLPRDAVRLDDGDLERLDVAADPDSVALVLGNLLRNAWQHRTGSARVPARVTVRLRPGPEPTVEIVNPVAPGAAFREGRFAKAAGSTGSGLGLAIARAAADRLGWRLDLAIRDGMAVARVRVPAPDAAADAAPDAAPARAPQRSLGPRPG